MFKNSKKIMTVAEMENRQNWLNVRAKGIGGSDAGVIMGLNPYKSAYQLWMEKTGQAEAPDLSGNQFIYWGRRMKLISLIGSQKPQDSQRIRGLPAFHGGRHHQDGPFGIGGTR